MPTAIKVRLFKAFTHYNSCNPEGRISEILGKLSKQISEKLDEIQEKSVLQLLEGITFYQNLNESDALNRQILQLNRELNDFVVEMAVKNPDLVDVRFLISYLYRFTKIQNPDF